MNAQRKTQILKIIYCLHNNTHVGKLTLESEQLWSYSLVTLGTICVSMTHALQYNTLCPSGTLFFSGLPMMI